EKHLENNQGGHNKFWSITVCDQGTAYATGYRYKVEIHYGKHGTRGMFSTKNFTSAKSCNVFVDKKIREKLAKGYVGVNLNGVATTVAASVPPTKATIAGLKASVANYANDLLNELPLGVNGEVI